MKNQNKEIKITVREIVLCGEEERSFCDIFVYEPENIEEQSLGNLYIMGEVIRLKENSSYIINLLASIIKKEFYSKTKRGTMESLESSLQKANNALSELAEQGNINWVGNLNMACGAYRSGEFYFSQAGKSRTLLIRNGQITDIGKSAAKEESANILRTFANIVSGELENNDMVMFATPELFNAFSLEKIRQMSSSMEMEDLAVEMQELMKKDRNMSTAGVLLMKIEEGKNSLAHLPLNPVAKAKIEEMPKVAAPVALPQIAEAEKEPAAAKEENISNAANSPKGISLENIIEEYEKAGTEKEAGTIMESALQKTPAPAPVIPPVSIPPAVEKVLPPMPEKDFSENPGALRESPVVQKALPGQAATSASASTGEIKVEKSKVNIFKIIAELFTNSAALAKSKASQVLSLLKKPKFKKEPENPAAVQDMHQDNTEKPQKAYAFGGKKLILAAIVLVVAALGANMYYTQYNQKKEEEQKVYSDMLAAAQEKSDKAEEMQITKDYAQARTLLRDARSMALEIKSKDKGLGKNADDLLGKIQKQIDSVDSINRIDNPQILADLGGGMKDPKRLIKTGDNYYIIDSENKFYQLDLENMKAIDTGARPDDNENLKLSASITKTGDIISLNDSNKIEVFDHTKKKITSRTIELPQNADIKDIATYSNNMYALDSASGQIYKYQMAPDSFGKGKEWLAKDKVTLGISFAVEGGIYVLNSDGTVESFLTGSKKNFSLGGLVDPISNTGKIYAKTESKSLFILDPANKRILQFDKDKGTLINQYASESFDNLKGIATDSKEEKIYALNGSRVFVIDIKK